MDLGNQDNSTILLQLLQYASYVIVAIFAYFGKKTLNDISKIKETKADKIELNKLEDRFDKMYNRQSIKMDDINNKLDKIWQHLASK